MPIGAAAGGHGNWCVQWWDIESGIVGKRCDETGTCHIRGIAAGKWDDHCESMNNKPSIGGVGLVQLALCKSGGRWAATVMRTVPIIGGRGSRGA